MFDCDHVAKKLCYQSRISLSRPAFLDIIHDYLERLMKRTSCLAHFAHFQLPSRVFLAPLISSEPSDTSSRKQFLFSLPVGYTPGFASLHMRNYASARCFCF